MSVAEKIIPEIIQPKKMGLLVENPVYKPFRYPWCYDAWLTQQRIHWLPEEVPLGDDVRDWTKNISAAEKNLLTHIFRFFTLFYDLKIIYFVHGFRFTSKSNFLSASLYKVIEKFLSLKTKIFIFILQI